MYSFQLFSINAGDYNRINEYNVSNETVSKNITRNETIKMELSQYSSVYAEVRILNYMKMGRQKLNNYTNILYNIFYFFTGC